MVDAYETIKQQRPDIQEVIICGSYENHTWAGGYWIDERATPKQTAFLSSNRKVEKFYLAKICTVFHKILL